MNVLFDTSALLITKTGVSNYMAALISALKKSALPLSIHEAAYRPVFSRNTPLRAVDSLYRDLLWPSLDFSVAAKQKGIDLVHCPAFNYPVFSKQKLLITVHDVYSLVKPDAFRRWHKNVTNYYIKKAVSSGRQLLVPTAFTKDEILRYFPQANPSNIHVVHSGIPNQRSADPDPVFFQQLKHKYGFNCPYLLSVSTVEPRKNFNRLIEAFATLAKHTNHTLVLVGQNGWNNAETYSLLERLKLKERVCFTGFVQDDELNSLYTNADCFVFPSMYEGFGFTPLEAMQCGCPVVSSNAACMPEVLGSAALYFNPEDAEEMASTVLQMLQSADKKKAYRARGLQQAARYNWAKTAHETYAVYKKIVEDLSSC